MRRGMRLESEVVWGTGRILADSSHPHGSDERATMLL
jgi:hypothetical protein